VSGRMATQQPVRHRSGPTAETTGQFCCGRPRCRPGSDTSARSAVSGVRPTGAVLREPAAGSAAIAGMQPAPVGASEPGGQAAAELTADIGHRRAGERVGLLEAEVVNLESGDFAVLAAANAAAAEPAGRPIAVIEDDSRQAWLDQVACRDQDPDRFSPSPASRSKPPRPRPSAPPARSATTASISPSRPPARSTPTTASSAAPADRVRPAAGQSRPGAERLLAAARAGRGRPPARQPDRAAAGRQAPRRPPRRAEGPPSGSGICRRWSGGWKQRASSLRAIATGIA